MRSVVPAAFYQWAQSYDYAFYAHPNGYIEVNRLCEDQDGDQWAETVCNAVSLREACESLIQDRIKNRLACKSRDWDAEKTAREASIEGARMMLALAQHGGDLGLLETDDGLCSIFDYMAA